MADLGNLKRRRTANRTVGERLIGKLNDVMSEETCSDDDRLELEATLGTIQNKLILIKTLDEEILDNIPTEEFEAEIEAATNYEIMMTKQIKKAENFLKKSNDRDTDSTVTTKSTTAHSVKLPKLFIKKFYGDPLQWQQFFDTFNAVVNDNDSISEVEKFTYLKGYLSGEAERSLEGLERKLQTRTRITSTTLWESPINHIDTHE